MDAITFQKLREIEARFGVVEGQMSDPVVVQDPSAYQKLAKESKPVPEDMSMAGRTSMVFMNTDVVRGRGDPLEVPQLAGGVVHARVGRDGEVRAELGDGPWSVGG